MCAGHKVNAAQKFQAQTVQPVRRLCAQVEIAIVLGDELGAPNELQHERLALFRCGGRGFRQEQRHEGERSECRGWTAGPDIPGGHPQGPAPLAVDLPHLVSISVPSRPCRPWQIAR
jgi:hypothetical protein